MTQLPSKPRGLSLLPVAAACFGLLGSLVAQGGPRRPIEPKPNQTTDPLLHSFEFRSIGPAVMMGRLDDIQGSAKDPMLLYIGFATGGLWKSTDGGNHWHSQFDNMANESIGAIAISASDPNVVYVGKGEANNRQSASIGDGVWGTTDGGKTWNHLGLENVQSINRIAIDPTNPKIVYASSFERRRNGWGYNGGGPNSGLWKSIDGGNTWSKLDGAGWPKPKDGLYGRIAIAIFPPKPTTIFAQVEAGAGAGTGSGTLATGGPEPPGRGGFGGGETADAAPAAPGAPGAPGAAAGAGGPGGRRAAAPPDPNGNGVYRSDDGGKTWTFLSNENQRPTYFSQIRVDPKNVNKLFVGGTPGQMSLDGGKTWKGLTGSHTDYHAIWINPADPRIVAVGHDGGLDISNDGGFTWDYHNDIAVGQFYQVSADMRHPYTVCGGLQDNNAWCAPSALRSNSGPVNTDWYTVAGGDGFYTRQDPSDWAIVYAESQDGEMSRHDLKTATQKSIKPTIAPPPAAPAAPGLTPPSGGAPAAAGATPAAPADAAAGGGGGGFGRAQVTNVVNAPKDVAPFRFYWNAPFEISPHNPAVIYMAAQYFFKSTNRGDSWTMSSTDLTKNLPRWDASRPIMGVAGDKPMVAKHDGYSSSSLATQVRESPSKPGVIWIGTDDGNLQVSQDDGATFTNVYGNLPGAPQGYVQISRIEPSHFDPATAYVAIDMHREDDWKPYLFKTTDYGKTFTNVTANLPANGNINALREDLENPKLLFVGTEFGMYISIDGAKSWQRFMNGLPSVRVDDILIHPRDRDLIVGTHGRSIWIMDDISPLEHLDKTENSDLALFEPRPAIQWKNDITAQRHVDNRDFVGENPQGGTAIHVFAKTDLGKGKVEFMQGTKVVSTMEIDVKAGLNSYQWNMRGIAPAGGGAGRRGGGGGGGGGNREMVPSDPNAWNAPAPTTPPATPEVPFTAGGGGGGGGGGFGRGGAVGPMLEPGTYMIKLTVGDKTATSSVDVLEDVWLRGQ